MDPAPQDLVCRQPIICNPYCDSNDFNHLSQLQKTYNIYYVNFDQKGPLSKGRGLSWGFPPSSPALDLPRPRPWLLRPGAGASPPAPEVSYNYA